MLLCEGILFLVGIIIIITGKVKMSGGKVVTGKRARVVGVIFLLPVPLGFLTGIAAGLSNPRILQSDTGVSDLVLIELAIIISCTIAGIIVGSSAPAPNETPQLYEPVPAILTPAEAARYLKVSEADVQQMIEAKKLRATLIGSEYRIAKDSLDELFRA